MSFEISYDEWKSTNPADAELGDVYDNPPPEVYVTFLNPATGETRTGSYKCWCKQSAQLYVRRDLQLSDDWKVVGVR